MAVKQCIKCLEEKPLEAFERSYGGGNLSAVHRRSQGCKDCLNETRALLRRLRRGSDRLTFQERFEQYYQPVPWSGCWIWTGAATTVNGHQHGLFNVDGRRGHQKVSSAYRIAWEMYVGPIPTGMCVLHKCDNRLCVNPNHLFIGTMKENTHDMIRKGRHPYIAHGQDHGFAKLNEANVQLIRNSEDSYSSLAVQFNVSKSNIASIKQGRSWKYLEDAHGG